MKIVAFAASTSTKSINKRLVTCAVELLAQEIKPGIQHEVLDLNDFDMPLFSQDAQDRDGIPGSAHELLERIKSADALIISFAEHNGGYTAAYKNAFDWMSRINMKVYDGKPIIALSTSPGKRGGASVLKAFTDSAPFFGAEVRASLSVPSFNDAFDVETNTLRDPEAVAELRAALHQL